MSTDEPDIEQQCSELGITIWKQGIRPVRVPRKAWDGSLLLVRSNSSSCSSSSSSSSGRLSAFEACLTSSCSSRFNYITFQQLVVLQDFPSEAARQQFKQTCIHKVSSNCLDGAR